MLTKIQNPISIKPLEFNVLVMVRNSVRIDTWFRIREPIGRIGGTQLLYRALLVIIWYS